ncbi:chemotaxis protein CheW [Bacterioplanes sanyensis]|uniref:chemotaxis protein CheW n=1 Tax=Bacterioplanes sanyensis TaxID=1249553 RepID=UPI001676B16A|nr:chemotaxis protein CheW [Bacterioplanes sanyensis]GGY39777.1 chemotaxis protein CheW [Bacterioplanes sanyensis]
MAESIRKTRTANQVDGVLQDYLDQLLITATEVKPVAEPAESLPSVESANAQALTSLVPQPAKAPLTEPVVDTAELDEPEIALGESGGGVTDLDWQNSQGVECLIFKVSGLKLAIPLPLLGGVHRMATDITPLFGQVSWVLGVWQSDDHRLSIVDSADLIMPERGVKLARDGFDYAIQLDRTPWALACQEICDTITLQKSSIKWRGEKGKRQWLAGTVISEMCALLDVPGLLSMLEEQRHQA